MPYDQGVWYGFAVKFAEPIPTDDHRYLIAQWKREIDAGADGDFSPFLALRVRNGKLFATVETNYLAPNTASAASGNGGCAGGGTPVWLRPDSNQMRALVATDARWAPEDGALYASCTDAIKVIDHGNKLPDPASGWIDFSIYTQPGPGRQRSDRALRQRQADCHGHRANRPCRQGARQEPILQVRTVPGRARD